ncbi:MAG: glycosyltransferase family 2 protein [Planctomycetota bacterium]
MPKRPGRCFRQIQWLVIHNGEQALPELQSDDADVNALMSSVLTSENLGYASAIQLALKQTQAPFLLVLNADLMPEPGCLPAVVKVTEEWESRWEKVGIVGFRLFNADGTPQGSAGQFPNFWRIVVGLLRPRARRKYLHLPLDQCIRVPWVTGASFLLSRECLNAIGGLDERFFMYYEDVDLCLRASEAGWTTIHDPAATWRHFHPYHGRPLTHRMVYFARHGLLRYFWKHRPQWEFQCLSRIVLFECWYRRLRDPVDQGWSKIESMVRAHGEDPERFRVMSSDLP